MKTVQWILFLAVAAVCLAATPVKKPATKKAVPGTASKTAASKTGGKPAPKGKTSASTRKGKGPARPVASSLRSRQQAPTQERYKEIQQALTDKGYLKSAPNGVWDAQSVDALKQYQAANNMPVTGKLTAPALIGLGLGPKRDSGLIQPPPVTPPATPTSTSPASASPTSPSRP
jgi:hypothetical protein